MKKITSLIIVMLFVVSVKAQQAVQYSQFMLNDYGLNPAVAGSSKGWQALIGRRTQWRGFDLAPTTNFASITKDFGKKGYKRFWHGIGAYIENDKIGIFNTKSFCGSYAIHLKLSSKLYMSVGVAAGINNVTITNSAFDINDPALTVRGPKVILPEIIPGIYLYSKKFSLSIAVHNLYKSALKQGSKEIGTEGYLLPAAYVTISRKYLSPGYDFVFVPSVHLQSNFRGIPSASVNFMAYYRKRVGLGISYRAHDAVSVILQVRVISNVMIGFAYDYTISRFHSASANSTEFMMGLSPVMSSEVYDRPNGAADCPKFDF